MFAHPREHETECLKLHRDCIKRMETMPVEIVRDGKTIKLTPEQLVTTKLTDDDLVQNAETIYKLSSYLTQIHNFRNFLKGAGLDRKENLHSEENKLLLEEFELLCDKYAPYTQAVNALSFRCGLIQSDYYDVIDADTPQMRTFTKYYMDNRFAEVSTMLEDVLITEDFAYGGKSHINLVLEETGRKWRMDGELECARNALQQLGTKKEDLRYKFSDGREIEKSDAQVSGFDDGKDCYVVVFDEKDPEKRILLSPDDPTRLTRQLAGEKITLPASMPKEKGFRQEKYKSDKLMQQAVAARNQKLREREEALADHLAVFALKKGGAEAEAYKLDAQLAEMEAFRKRINDSQKAVWGGSTEFADLKKAVDDYCDRLDPNSVLSKKNPAYQPPTKKEMMAALNRIKNCAIFYTQKKERDKPAKGYGARTQERISIAEDLFKFVKGKKSVFLAERDQLKTTELVSKTEVRKITARNFSQMIANSQATIRGTSSREFTALQDALADYQKSVGGKSEGKQLRELRTAAKAYIKYKNDQGPDKWTANGKERVKIAKLIGKFSSISIAELTKQQPAPKRQVAQAQNNALNINNVNNGVPKRGRGILSK